MSKSSENVCICAICTTWPNIPKSDPLGAHIDQAADREEW